MALGGNLNSQCAWMANIEDLGQARGANGMAVEDALVAVERIKLHLVRGSIDTARAALEQAWSDHLEATQELPIGAAVLDVPLSRVIDNLRLLNLLEGAGILTVGKLLMTSPGELSNIPSMGVVSVNFLRNLGVGLANRACAEPPKAASQS
jgi:hypothetical protein